MEEDGGTVVATSLASRSAAFRDRTWRVSASNVAICYRGSTPSGSFGRSYDSSLEPFRDFSSDVSMREGSARSK